ncbi:MAG: glycosyltransferase family 39 protein [Oscillospiraceae bacterium]|jgi:4-amino-4-deoxy-L-arabinose transferase-like glycosyltransferase|nr:glycosyltransferase family 39 protein [Oscillospiraceae bacterium]
MKQIFAARSSLPAHQRPKWYLAALAGIALLSFWLNFYAISQIGYGNAYYAAAIKSMTQSWHNFFFVSFDPAGLVSVDKPPLGLWVQCLFVWIFGYHGWAMLLPQALAGTGSSIMMYILTAKRFGRPAGLLSAAVLALTPAVVVASRNNTMDMQLVFVLLVAVWFLFRAIDSGKWRYLFGAAILLGLGFNIKMLEAYMILPAVVLVYLIFAKEKFSKRLIAGLISAAVMAAVSFAWVLAVDLYPSSSRPYVGSSTNNTVWELIIGHNGMERLSGGMGGMRSGMGHAGRSNDGRPNGQNSPSPVQGNQDGGGTPFSLPSNRNGTPPTAGGNANSGRNSNSFPGGGSQNGFQGRTGGSVGNDIGTAGPLRLWQSSLYGQASWLIILALFSILACVQKFSGKKRSSQRGMLLFWTIWLITGAVFFSFAGFWHRYYLCILAPAIAGLAGMGLPEMLRAFRDKDGWRRWLLPLALAASDSAAAIYVWNYSQLRSWLFPIIAGFGIVALAAMAVWLFRPKKVLLSIAAGSMILSMLAGPFYWSLTAALYVCENITMPYAGPELTSNTKTPGMTANQQAFTESDSATTALEQYLVKHYQQGTYLVMAQRANDVAQIIVDTGLPAAAYGGFLGSDQSLTLEQFQSLAEAGKITYFLAEDSSGMGGSSDILSYVKENAKLVDPSEYGGADSTGQSGFSLYCFSHS